MSLLNPTPGQILDRWAALKVKIVKFQKAKKAFEHFEKEQKLLAIYVSDLIEAEEADLLVRLHAKLWRAIDNIENPNFTKDTVANNAILAQRMNRKRYEIIKQIDQRLGCYEGEEKL